MNRIIHSSPGIVLTILIVAQVAFMAIWRLSGYVILTKGDELSLIQAAANLQDSLSGSPPEFIKNWYIGTGVYPPLYPALAVPFWIIFGRSYESALVVNYFLLVASTVVVYLAGKQIVGPLGGIAAAIVFISSPYLNDTIYRFLDESALILLLLLTIYLLWQSQGFSRLWPTLGVGLVMTLGFFVKWSYGFFVLGAVIVEGVRFLSRLILAWKDGQGPVIRDASVAVAAGLPVLVAGPWYVLNRDPLQNRFDFYTQIPAWNPLGSDVLSIRSALWYLFTFDDVVGMIAGSFALIGLFLFFKNRSHPLLTSIVAALVGSYIILTLIQVKLVDHFSPSLGLLAILTVYGASALPWKHFAKVAISLLLVSSLFQLWVLYSDRPWLLHRTISIGSQPVAYEVSLYPSPLTRERQDWGAGEVLQVIEDEMKSSGQQTAGVVILGHGPGFMKVTFSAEIFFRNLPLSVIDIGSPLTDFRPQAVIQTEYFVVKAGELYPDTPTNREIRTYDFALARWLQEGRLPQLEFVASIPLAYNAKALVFKRSGEPTPELVRAIALLTLELAPPNQYAQELIQNQTK